jgi:CheY-like chemotaxis protein
MAGAAYGDVRILLVEDEALIAMFAADTLASAGHTVVGSAGTAAAAVQMAAALKPDLIVMDVRLSTTGHQLPDGMSAAVEIFRTTGIRSLFAAAQLDDETKGRAAKAQPYGWLMRPYAAADLLRVIEAGPALASLLPQ